MNDKLDNLDFQCAAKAQKMAEGVEENTIRSALGVLQEDGIYACFLYLLSQKDKGGARHVFNNALELLKEVRCQIDLSKETNKVTVGDLPRIFQKLGENLDQLFFAKDMLERTLIYARYHCKAKA